MGVERLFSRRLSSVRPMGTATLGSEAGVGLQVAKDIIYSVHAQDLQQAIAAFNSAAEPAQCISRGHV